MFFLTYSLVPIGNSEDYIDSDGEVDVTALVDSVNNKKKAKKWINVKDAGGFEDEISLQEKKGNPFRAFLYRKLQKMTTEDGIDSFENVFLAKIPFFLFFTIPVLAFIIFLFFYKK